MLRSYAAQAEKHLAGMPTVQEYKRQMVQRIVADREVPTRLQFSLSQRLYYEELLQGDLFWAQNDPECIWIENISEDRRKFMLHWAVYDSQINLPVLYLLELEDSGRTALPKDQYRWPEVQAYLAGQALAALKLLTIAKGFDETFDDCIILPQRPFQVLEELNPPGFGSVRKFVVGSGGRVLSMP